MAVVHKTVFLAYSAQQMYDLVGNVEQYPKFLPWCGGVKVLEQSDTRVVVSLDIHYHGIKQTFTTANDNTAPTQMKMTLVDGPFKCLDGTWHFKPLRDDACKVELDLHYEFSNRVLENLIGPVFGVIANSMVDSFCKRAETVYG